MKIDFTNKVVIVTGGTKGIGRSFVKQFLENNAKVIFTGTKKKPEINEKITIENKNAIYRI